MLTLFIAAPPKGGLVFDDADSFADDLDRMGIPVLSAHLRLISDSSIAVWERMKRAMGIAAMLDPVAAHPPDTIRILPELVKIPVSTWRVTHQARQTTPRIRLVQQMLSEGLSGMSSDTRR